MALELIDETLGVLFGFFHDAHGNRKRVFLFKLVSLAIIAKKKLMAREKCLFYTNILHFIQFYSIMLLFMNSQDVSGGNSLQSDGVENLCRRGDEVIEYIFTAI